MGVIEEVFVHLVHRIPTGSHTRFLGHDAKEAFRMGSGAAEGGLFLKKNYLRPMQRCANGCRQTSIATPYDDYVGLLILNHTHIFLLDKML
jgi:hypothetical protein